MTSTEFPMRIFFWALACIGVSTAFADEPGRPDIVTATGVVQPAEVIDVGAMVGGRIQSVHADFRSEVKKGEVLAKIDPGPFEAALTKSKVGLQQAEALLGLAKAKLIQTEKQLEHATKTKSD